MIISFPPVLPPRLKTHCWWPRGRPWPCQTGALPVLLGQAHYQLLAFLQVSALQRTELIIAGAKTYRNGYQRPFWSQGPDLRRILPRSAGCPRTAWSVQGLVLLKRRDK